MVGTLGKSAIDRFLRSKLTPPQLRVNLIERPGLIRKLEDGLKRRLTLVHAPAGFGKTTLLMQWHAYLGIRNVPVAWMTFDQDDADPLQVLDYLAQSLASTQPSLHRIQAQASPRATPRAIRDILARILNELVENDETVLVLDDYHLVNAPEIHDLVLHLIHGAPVNLHIIVAARNRSMLPVSNLIVQGQVTEIEANDLRFSQAEIRRVFGPELDPSSLEILLKRTEGWAMAVQLAHHWMQRNAALDRNVSAFASGSGDVALYLTEQIMADLPEDVRQLLVQTSIADEINGDLANTLCGRTDAWEVLASLEHLSALLVPVDPAHGWFRFHHLFSDYLRSQLKMLGEERLCALHMAASEWFAQHGRLDRAVRHACLAGNAVRASEYIENAGAVWLSVQHGSAKLKRLLAYLSADLVDSRPRLRAARALLWMKEGLITEAEKEIGEIRQMRDKPLWNEEVERDILLVGAAFSGQGDDGISIESVQALEALVRRTTATNRWVRGVLNELLSVSYLRRGNVILANAPGREALHIYEQAGAVSGRVFSRLHLGISCLAQGQLVEALDMLRFASNLAEEQISSDTPTIAMIEIMLANALYEQNELAEAADLCFQAMEEAENAEGWFEIYHAGYITASGIYLAQGDFDNAFKQLDKGQRTAERRGLKRLKNALDYRKLEIETFRKSVNIPKGELIKSLNELENLSEDMTVVERESMTFAVCRLAIQEGLAEKAERILRSLQQLAEKLGRGRSVIRILVLRAFAHQALGAPDKMSASLREALSMAAPQGWRRIFLEEGPAITELLDEFLKHVHISSLTPETISFLAELFSAQIDPDGRRNDDPARLLKPREFEVLQGLQNGFSNKVIARELELTDNTIKYHLKKIYAKLGVGDRNMAVIVAKRHGML